MFSRLLIYDVSRDVSCSEVPSAVSCAPACVACVYVGRQEHPFNLHQAIDQKLTVAKTLHDKTTTRNMNKEDETETRLTTFFLC